MRINRAEWCREDVDERVYLFNNEGLREALTGFDFKRSLDALQEAGALGPGTRIASSQKCNASAQSDPDAGLLTIYSLRDILARWSSPPDEATEGEIAPIVYVDDVLPRLLNAFESLAVSASESMQQLFRMCPPHRSAERATTPLWALTRGAPTAVGGHRRSPAVAGHWEPGLNLVRSHLEAWIVGSSLRR
jgi:hypothetical protein